ncbi:hypothetical protein E2562_000318 [Oryza meyeriana var. granulata]|uniref:Uncharacterized protein n=1 Tax=Oryza meyeriana var. granulata TaxID=110450 RepID=A0A6G1CMZ5_9ORYZ|nr:hypothetical protein E2562_000318 [Oryza meyeriana var. granulata]
MCMLHRAPSSKPDRKRDSGLGIYSKIRQQGKKMTGDWLEELTSCDFLLAQLPKSKDLVVQLDWRVKTEKGKVTSKEVHKSYS